MAISKKQTILLGALTGSAGIFITKLMGIFYLSPLTALAGETNLTYYSYAYGVYDNLLNIVEAGLPFAIATMIAKYYLKKDFKSIRFIRKLYQSIMLGFGFIAFCICFFGSGPIAKFIIPVNADVKTYEYTKNVLMIIALAFFTVPLLAGERGYFQGLKDMKLYATSQVLEQFVRITFLLTCAFVCVSLLAFDGIYAIYGAVASAFISGTIAFVHLYFSRKQAVKQFDDLANEQILETVNKNELISELVSIAIPYLLTSFLGNSMNIINTNFFSKAMDNAGYEAGMTTILYSMIMVTTNKLTSIPQFLSKGYSAAIIPYVTDSYEKNDRNLIENNILDCLNSALYLAMPLCFCLFALGPEIYYVMYGSNTSWQLGGEVLSLASFLAFTGTISPIVTSLTMAVRLSSKVIINLGIGFLVKLVTFFPLIERIGYSGAIWSSVLCGFVTIILNLRSIEKIYKLNFKKSYKMLYFMLLSCMGMESGFSLLQMIGLDVCNQGRFVALIYLGLYGIVGILIYVFITYLLKVPQYVFHFNGNIKELMMKILKRG